MYSVLDTVSIQYTMDDIKRKIDTFKYRIKHLLHFKLLLHTCLRPK